MIYVPGALFSVNPVTARGVPQLFARNERVACVFEGENGPFVLVLVGATEGWLVARDIAAAKAAESTLPTPSPARSGRSMRACSMPGTRRSVMKSRVP